MRWYSNRDERPATALQQMLLHAVFFGAFSHLDHNQLRGSQFGSVVEGQNELFRVARNLFHANAKTEKTIALAQTALILSFWSPCDTTAEVNVYWVDRAMQYAIAVGCSEPTSTQRKRVILWCCLVRDRTIMLCLRQPRSLFTVNPGRLPALGDFTDEFNGIPKPINKSKRCMAGAFILMCKLCMIMTAIIESRTKIRWVSWWQDHDGMGQYCQLDEVTALEERFDVWRHDFDMFRRAMDDLGLKSNECSYLHFLLITSM
jgi:hypothetical protein